MSLSGSTLPQTSDGWLITKTQITHEDKLVYTFLALLVADLTSDTLFLIVQSIALTQRGLETSDKSLVSYMWLNDGTLYRDHIVSMHGDTIVARRIYNSTFLAVDNDTHVLSWREPHIIVEEEQRKINFWEEHSVALPIHIAPGHGY